MKFSKIFNLKDEDSHQCAFIAWCKIAERHGFACAWAWTNDEDFGLLADPLNAVSELQFIHSIPNGANMGDTQKQRMINAVGMKRAGLLSGVFDVFLPVRNFAKPSGIYSGFYIEFKHPKFSANPTKALSANQKAFKIFVESQSFKTGVYCSWNEAALAVEKYLN
jgi:hypothetical protein